MYEPKNLDYNPPEDLLGGVCGAIDWDAIRVEEAKEPIIKVIGIGGGGGNAVANMFREGISGVSYLVCNTDGKALSDSPIAENCHLQLGSGLGAGGRPEVGRQMALESVEDIKRALGKHLKMVFLTAGMGGGTGTGAAPVIAKEAKKLGILTIGIVTIPFVFEGRRKIDKALDGVDELAKCVDAILVINNERLRVLYPDFSLLNAFEKADQTLTTAVQSIVEITQQTGKVNLDFNDVNNCLRNGGMAVMSSGVAEGDNRVAEAIKQAITSPLLNTKDIYKATRVIINIAFSQEHNGGVQMYEVDAISHFFAKFHKEYDSKYGLTNVPNMGGKVKVTILASGFNVEEMDLRSFKGVKVMTKEDKVNQLRRQQYYPNGTNTFVRKPANVYLFGTEDLDNEKVVAQVERVPTYKRTREEYKKIKAITEPETATIVDLSYPLG